MKELSFVFPCLNEEVTLAECIRAVRKSLEVTGVDYEIVVADNGSTDRSREIAVAEGARVVPVAARGYGAALRGGIEAAEGGYVMFADADGTYLYEDAGPLWEKAKGEDADMAIASRMTGKIEEGAMPFLHRRLGTPVLTGLINVLFRGKLSDCNSGFRCVRKSAYVEWDIRSGGMEFASELLIKALKAGAKTVEIDSGLRPDPPERVAHLRTWRDGMRHLLFILSERPQLFEWAGIFLVVVSSLVQAATFFMGPTEVLGMYIFDVHSQVFLLLASLVGVQIYAFSCFLYLGSKEPRLRVTERLIEMGEGTLFFLLLGLFGIGGLIAGGVVVVWMLRGFAGLDLVNEMLVLTHFLSVPGFIGMALLGIHVVKKGAGSAT